MAPIQKWYLGLCIPVGILLVFGLWYRCLPPDSIAKNTVKEAGVQVGFVWLFVTIVTSSLKIFDCDEETLIMDPSEPCPLSSEGNIGLALLGLMVLFLYIVVPYFWFFVNQFECECSCSDEQASTNNAANTNTSFKTAFGWAFQNFKESEDVDKLYIEGFELWNMVGKTSIIVGSTIMYSESRFITHIIVTSLSLLLHVCLLPYREKNCNIAAILFCLCDIFGVLSARFSSPVVEVIFIACTLATIITVGVFIFRAVRKQAASLRDGLLANNKTSDIFAMYTPLEKKLLFPVLAVVWVCVKLFRKLSTKEKDGIALTKVVPEKDKEVKEENEQNDEQNKTEEADEVQQTKELEEIRNWD
jgi:hypothetical protein